MVARLKLRGIIVGGPNVDIHAKSAGGESALDLARRRGNFDIVRFLERADAKGADAGDE